VLCMGLSIFSMTYGCAVFVDAAGYNLDLILTKF
jgi:hypothetical protein